MNGFRFIIPALVPHIRAEFGMDLSTIGLLLTLLWVAYAVGQVPGGLLGDRFGERNILVGSAVFGLAMIGLIVISPHQYGFFIAVIGFGLALGFYSPTRLTVLTDMFPTRSGTVIGLNLGFSSVGLTVLPIIGAFLAGAIGWRIGLGFVLPFLLVSVIGLWIAVPKRTSKAMKSGESTFESLGKPLATIRDPPVIAAIGAMFCMHFLFQGFTSFYPTYLVDIKGMSEEFAAIIFGLFFALGTVMQPASGVIGDRIGARRAMLLIVGITVAGMLALPLSDWVPMILLVTAILSIQRGFWPIANSYLIDLFPEDIQSTGLGFSRTTYILLAASGPVIVGAIANAGYFEEAFLMMAALAALGGACIIYLMITDPQ